MTPAIQVTLTTATRHWFGDAEGQGAWTFRGVTLEQFCAVRQQAAVRLAEAHLNTVALTGDVPATEEACQALTRVYQRALRQRCEEGAA